MHNFIARPEQEQRELISQTAAKLDMEPAAINQLAPLPLDIKNYPTMELR